VFHKRVLILRFFHLRGARDWQPHKSVSVG
jgi:hypothetical protein